MFFRILKQLLRASGLRLAVSVLAVASGASVTAALINLQLDAEHKLTREFRTLGANLIISPTQDSTAADASAPLADAKMLDQIAPIVASTPDVTAAPYLYVVARADASTTPQAAAQSVILTGTWLDQVERMSSWWQVEGQWVNSHEDSAHCLVGRNVARQLGLAPGSVLELHYGERSIHLIVSGVASAGGTEDNQIFVNLPVAQRLGGLEGRIALVQLSVAGTPRTIEHFAARLSAVLPGFAVRPVRQLAQAEAELLGRIRSLLLGTVVLILVLTALCVLATMAALATERRRDVGLMKALGGPVRRVVRLFLVEAASLGVLGGLVGYAGGVVLSKWIGRRVFDVAISPRLEVLPLTVGLMIVVALAGAFPLRLLGRVKPAEILRGE
jgi:putative ABC transport system permease protein